MDQSNEYEAQDTQATPEMSAELQQQIQQQATQQLELGKSLIDSDPTAALGALAEAAYLFIGLRDDAAGDALGTLVNFVQSMGEEQFDTATSQLDEQHRDMLDQIVTLLQQMEQGEGEEGDEQPLTPEVQAELNTRAAQQLSEGKEAASNEEFTPALNSLVEAAAIYVALDDERKEEALAAFVGLLQSIPPDELNNYVAQLDEQHQRWMMGLMNLLQQRTIEEHGPEIRASAQASLAQAEQATEHGDNTAALLAYGEAYSNAASLQDSELASQIITSFGAMADNIGPGALGEISSTLDERGAMAFQMLLGALADFRDPSPR